MISVPDPYDRLPLSLFFVNSSTTALMQKIAKEFDEAKFVMDKVVEMEQAANAGQKRAHSTGDSSSSLASKQK